MRCMVAAVRSLSWSSLSLSFPNSQLNPEKAFEIKMLRHFLWIHANWFQMYACSCLQCYPPSYDSQSYPQTTKPNCLHEHECVPRRWTLFTWVAGTSYCSASKLFCTSTSLSVQTLPFSHQHFSVLLTLRKVVHGHFSKPIFFFSFLNYLHLFLALVGLSFFCCSDSSLFFSLSLLPLSLKACIDLIYNF